MPKVAMRKINSNGIRWLCSAVATVRLLSTIASAGAQTAESNVSGDHVVLAWPPVVAIDAIPLSQRMANPAKERWIRLQGTNAPVGVAKPPGTSELVVWNVSTPTLQPFLPDPLKATGAAMIVVPGGGFTGLAIDREGYAVARWLIARGIVAFVLKYRVMPMPEEWSAVVRLAATMPPTKWRQTSVGTVRANSYEQRTAAMRAAQVDGLEAIGYVRAHASKWRISSRRIGIVGFSAGAVTALNVAVNADPADRPDIVGSIYGALVDGETIPSTAPPVFVAAAADDSVCPSTASLTIYSAFRAAGVPAELHIFEDGGHGFGILHQGRSSDHWARAFDQWLYGHGFETTRPGKAE